MLALRLTAAARPAVHLRRLLVATAAAGTGFLLLCALGYALGHPGNPPAATLRLAWCAVPLAATVHFAVAVARTDPGTRPQPGLSALGLGPARLMAVSALTTALSSTLGSMVALLLFLHLRGDLTGMPFDGAATGFLAAGEPLPLPATLTLLALVPVIASATVALLLRPRDPRAPAEGAPRRLGARGRSAGRETFGTYGRFGARFTGGTRTATDTAAPGTDGAGPGGDGTGTGADGTPSGDTGARPGAKASRPAGGAAAAAAGRARFTSAATAGADDGPAAADGDQPAAESQLPDADWAGVLGDPADPTEPPAGLPWGVAVLAAGLAVEAYTGGSAGSVAALPGGAAAGTAGVLVGWALTALGMMLAGPGLTHFCGRLVQSVRPGALRLLAGRALMAEATRIGRPLGVVCAVASGAFAMTALYADAAPSFGPLTTLGALLVTGCTVATLLTAAVEARQSRAGTVAALLRLGAPAGMLRGAAALRAAALLAVFGPLTLIVADLAALPLTR